MLLKKFREQIKASQHGCSLGPVKGLRVTNGFGIEGLGSPCGSSCKGYIVYRDHGRSLHGNSPPVIALDV